MLSSQNKLNSAYRSHQPPVAKAGKQGLYGSPKTMALMKKKSALGFVMILALFAASFLQLYAQDGYGGGGGKGPCCDSCRCTRSIPPQCRCVDIKPYCHPSCKGCLCTKSIPPQCRCTDVKPYCDKPCSTPPFL